MNMTDKKYNVELSKREIALIKNMVLDKLHHGEHIALIRDYLDLYDKLIEETTIN